MDAPDSAVPVGWRAWLPAGVRPYVEPAPLAAAFLGISSGFAFAMIGATLTTRLAQYGIRKSAVTAFALTFLAYNFKFLWAPLVDTVRLPFIGRFGQRRSWLWFVGVVVMVAVAALGAADPETALPVVAAAAISVGIAGATFDIAAASSALVHCASNAASASSIFDWGSFWVLVQMLQALSTWSQRSAAACIFSLAHS